MTFAIFNATEILPKTRVALFAHVRLCLYTLLIFASFCTCVAASMLCAMINVSVFLCSTVSRNLCVFFLAQQQRLAGEARPRQQQFTAGRRRKAAAKERLQVCSVREPFSAEPICPSICFAVFLGLLESAGYPACF